MLKRNAKVFSKDDMDMGRTNLVKHHIKLTDPVPFKEAYRKIPPQMYDEVCIDSLTRNVRSRCYKTFQ